MRQSISRRSVLAGGIAAIALPLFGSRGRAQAEWPSKPIRIVAGFAAGGQTDLFARNYAEFITQQTGQTVIVDNKAGGGGVIAAQELKRARPDGYTMMFTSTTPIVTNRVLIRNIPYDTDKDFIIVSIMPTGGLPFVAASKTGASNLKEFIEYAKGAGNISIGTWAAGSSAHIAIAELNKQYGLKMEPVHYRGEAPMWTDLAGGWIDGAIGSYGASLSVLQSGRGKAVAVTRKRLSALPDVATFEEQGATSRGFNLTGYQCCSVPAGTPQDVIQKLSGLLVAGGKSPKIQEMLKAFGIEDTALSFEDTQSLYRTELPVWLELVSSLGLTPG